MDDTMGWVVLKRYIRLIIFIVKVDVTLQDDDTIWTNLLYFTK